MPEPDNNVQGAQGEAKSASTPAKPDEPKTTTVKQSDPLMDALGIPADVQAQLTPTVTAAEPELKGDVTPATSGKPDEATPEKTPEAKAEPQPEPEPKAEAIIEDDDDEDDDDDFVAPKDQKLDKKDRRIIKLRRSRNNLRDTVSQLQDRLDKYEKKAQEQAESIPFGKGPLANVTTEDQLDEALVRCNGIIDWCDANAEGATQSNDKGEESFIEPKTIDKWRRDAQRVVLNAESRRREIRDFNADKARFDTLAKQAWPELFDKRTKEYQLAQSILDDPQYQAIKSSPQVNYAVGLVIEGMKSVQSRVKAAVNGNVQPTKQRRDIDERAFGPRVPIAPSTPEPPSREPDRASSKQRFNQAMSNLVKDPDGSAASLAKVFDAEDAMLTGTKPVDGRTPVRA